MSKRNVEDLVEDLGIINDPVLLKKLRRERKKYEQSVKRIRADYDGKIAEDVAHAEELEREAQDTIGRVSKAYWEHVFSRKYLLYDLERMDFPKVSSFMEAIPELNAALRMNADFWKRRIILEYPEYWDPNGVLRSDESLIPQAKAGLTRRTMGEPTERDEYYLIYQKARRMTQFLRKLAAYQLANPEAELPNIGTFLTEKFLSSGVTVPSMGPYILTKIEPVGFEDQWRLDIMDPMRSSGLGRTVRLTAPGWIDPRSTALEVHQGTNYAVAVFSNRNSAAITGIHVVDLTTGERITQHPFPLDSRQPRFVSIDRYDVLTFHLRKPKWEDLPTTFKLTVGKFLEWTKEEWFDYGDLQDKTQVAAGTQIELTRGTESGSKEKSVVWKLDFTNERWFRGEPLRVAPANRNIDVPHVVASNLRNSYERPAITVDLEGFEDGKTPYLIESGLAPLTDGIRWQDRVSLDPRIQYVVTLESEYVVAVQDQSDLMRPPEQTQFRLRLGTKVQNRGASKPSAFIYADRLVIRNFDYIQIYNLWDFFRSTLPPSEQEKPLINESMTSQTDFDKLCTVCSNTATGACSICRTTKYCSAECMENDKSLHSLTCITGN